VPITGVDEVSWTISNTGVGIAPEDQEAVFEEFRQVGTAAKKVEGTGLGLALYRKFVELGGRIWAKSQEGVGSTFTFTILTQRGEWVNAITPAANPPAATTMYREMDSRVYLQQRAAELGTIR